MVVDFFTSSIDLHRGSKAFSNKFLNSSFVRPPVMVCIKKKKKEENAALVS